MVPPSPVHKVLLRFVAVATFACGEACTATVAPPPPPPPPLVADGSAIVDWTLDGAKDPAACAASGATTLNVVLYNSTGAPEGQWNQDCVAFATTISDLVPDTYTGTANLLDAANMPRTTSVQLAPFSVIAGTTVTTEVDFPGNSFF